MPRSSRLEERQLLNEIYKSAQNQKQHRIAAAPEVGIFWFVDGKPLVDGTPLPEAKGYGDFKIHDRDHYNMWGMYQRNHIVSQELEYEDPPRGRVVYNAKTKKFVLFADPHILKNKSMVSKIKELFHLPPNTELASDEHYRCMDCTQSGNAYSQRPEQRLFAGKK